MTTENATVPGGAVRGPASAVPPQPARGTPIENMAAALASGGTGHGLPMARHIGGQFFTRRAMLAPQTLDVAARVAEATIATNAPIQRGGQRPDGSYGPWLEVLDLNGASLERLIGGPVLVDHDHHRSEARVGAIESVRREGGQLIARLRFSERDDVTTLLRDLAAGIGGSISIGYTVEQWGVS